MTLLIFFSDCLRRELRRILKLGYDFFLFSSHLSKVFKIWLAMSFCCLTPWFLFPDDEPLWSTLFSCLISFVGSLTTPLLTLLMASSLWWFYVGIVDLDDSVIKVNFCVISQLIPIDVSEIAPNLQIVFFVGSKRKLKFIIESKSISYLFCPFGMDI